jgi:rubrerythrin
LFEGKTPIKPIPERRPPEKQARAYELTAETQTEKLSKTAASVAKASTGVKLKLWYCKQCGYVVFREEPPYVCPICKAKKEMFAILPITAFSA